MGKWSVFLSVSVLASAATLAADSTKSVFEGNEAVTADKVTGERKVEYPPFLVKDAAQMPSWRTETNQGTPAIWYMIEGPNGLLECGGLTISPQACRASTLGTYKWRRHWVVKKAGQWVLCAGGKKPYRCAPRDKVVLLIGNSVPE